jgi:hypothetical protein
MKRLFFILTVSVLWSCGSSTKKATDHSSGGDWPLKVEITRLAVHTLTDSGRLLEWSPCVVVKDVITDSVTKKDRIVIDTLWWITRMVPAIDKVTGKEVLDSLKKPVLEKKYFSRPRDSVRWEISGIPMDSLLSKKAPTH